jgi:O-antigen/teichoic acid export membrane protein
MTDDQATGASEASTVETEQKRPTFSPPDLPGLSPAAPSTPSRPRHRGPKHAKPRPVLRILLTGALWNNLSSFVPIAANIALTPYLIHGFGIERWGLLALVSSISVFFGPLGGGLGGTMTRYFALYAGRDDRQKTTETLITVGALLVVLGCVATLVSWFASPLFMDLFSVHGSLRSEGTFLLRTLGILVAASFLHNLFNAIINARQRYAFTNTLSIATSLAGYGGLVLSVQTGAGLRGVALVYVGQQLLASAATVPCAVRYMTREGVRFLSRSELKEILRYAASVQLMGVISVVNSEVDSLLVGGLFRLRAMAFYNAGSTVASGLRNLTYNFLAPFGTHLTHAFARGGDQGTVRPFERLQRAWVVITTGICSTGLGASYFAVVEWLGPQFRLGGEVAAIALAGHLVNLWTGVLTQYLAAVGRPEIEARYAACAMLLNVLGTLALVLLGPLGVAGGGALAAIVASLYLVRLARARYNSQTTSFLKEVPLFPALIGFVATASLEKLAQPYAPQGPIGLLFSGVPALAGLVVYALAVLGRRSPTFLRTLLRLPIDLPRLAELAFFG